MLQTSARLLRLLSMLQARRFWAGPDLAQRLEVTDRTLRRDMDRLRTLGYPVHATSGIAGGYALGAGVSLPPLMLDDAEAVAVAIALQTAAGTLAGIEDAAQRALAKLENVLPSRLRRRVRGLRGSIVRLSSGPDVQLEAVSQLAAACSDSLELQFSYRDRSGNAAERTVELHRQARVILHGSQPALAARLPPSAGFLQPIDATHCRFETGANSLNALAGWLLVLDVDFEIEAPAELAAYVRRLSERLARTAGAPVLRS
jgi:predicted DNA-binding transcriptional regulator YafY